MVVGGDKLEYPWHSGSPATDLTETKILLNSIISDASSGAQFASMDLKDFFPSTPMARPEFMKMKLKYFPPDIIKKYNLMALVHTDGYIYIQIIKGLYGLKQAALNAYKYLSKLLTNGGYESIPNTLGMWKHSTRRTIFNLCVDDFGIKYYNNEGKQIPANLIVSCVSPNTKYKISSGSSHYVE